MPVYGTCGKLGNTPTQENGMTLLIRLLCPHTLWMDNVIEVLVEG